MILVGLKFVLDHETKKTPKKRTPDMAATVIYGNMDAMIRNAEYDLRVAHTHL